MSTADRRHGERNRLLLALSRAEYGRLLPSLEVVPLPAGHVLYEAHQTITTLYFPQRCVIEVHGDVEDGRRAEVQTIGNEGMAGLGVFLGGDVALARTVAQIPDHATRMSATAFRSAVRRSTPLRKLMLRYTRAVLGSLSRTPMCHRMHGLEARCARWLLTTQDRVGADRFVLTQESLATMLGVRRPSTSLAAGALRGAGLIRYSRGRVTILDRLGLEAAACSCYRVLHADYERLLGLGDGQGKGSRAGRR